MKSSLFQPLFKSFLPLLIGGSFHLLKETSKILRENLNFLGIKEGWNDRKAQDHFFQMNPEEEPSDLLSRLDQITFGVYSNFIAFLLVMFLIDGLSRIIELGTNVLQKETKSINIKNSFSHKNQELIYLKSEKFIMRILSYALIFTLFQIAGLGFLSLSSNQTFKSHRDESLVAIEKPQDTQMFSSGSRTLEEEEFLFSDHSSAKLNSSPPPISDKISLSMGNILSALSLNANEMIMTKDKKIAYVTLDYYGTLKVINISDVQSPFIIASLNLEVSTYAFRVKNLVLSSDEKTLYSSNSRDLEIIDVADPSSPKRISLTKSEIFATIVLEELSKFAKTSIAVSESTKTLYIGGMGFQVYNISDPTKPVLLKASKNEQRRGSGLLRNEVCLSQDGKILFVANGTLNVYNVSNPSSEMEQIYSFATESFPRSLLLSEDGKTLFLLGNSDQKGVVFEEADISDLGSFKIRNVLNFDRNSLTSPRFLAVSPSKSKFFVLADFGTLENVELLIFDRLKQTVRKNEGNLVEKALALGFSADGRTLITASNNQFMTIELFLDYPNSQTFSESLENLISSFSLQGLCSKMQISNDQNYLFILRSDNEKVWNTRDSFEIWDVKNKSQPKRTSVFNLNSFIRYMHFTKDFETVYFIGFDSIWLFDISDRSSIKMKRTFTAIDKTQIFGHFTTSLDEKTGFLVLYKEGFGKVTHFDLSESSPSLIDDSVAISARYEGPKDDSVVETKIIVKDERTLTILNKGGFFFYDVSNLSSPSKIIFSAYGLNEPSPTQLSAAFSPDKKTLYIETADLNGYHKFRVFDVSDCKEPRIISEKDLSQVERYTSVPGFSLSPDGKSGFIYQNNTLVRLNLKNPKEIKIAGVVPLSGDKANQASSYIISPDSQTVYANIKNQIRIVNVNIKYSLFLKQEKIVLGEKYTGKVALLSLTAGTSEYNPLDSESYKITRLSLLDMKFAPSKLVIEEKKDILPTWITFDSEGDILTVEAKKQRDIGTHTIHSAFSLKIPKDVFADLGKTGKPVSSKNLWAWLISLGYVDNQRFLTANFGFRESFYLPEEFEDHETEIYDLLKQFYFETCTGFEVAPSLEFKEKNESLGISTLSFNSIKVDIKLEPKGGADVRFVSSAYGSIVPVVKNNNKTRISLEGSLKEINTALNSIVVNFENGTLCDASIMINDGYNPTISEEVTNISRYFKANTPPALNNKTDKTMQEQIDGADIQTGIYFTFTLTNDIFEDKYVENLSYEMVMAKNGTAFPAWLSFSGLTLKGTPPEQVLGRDIDLMLIAKNEFKESRVLLRLHVKMSLAFYLQLVLKYIPYILTIVGVLVSANKIWNILGKRYYKHSKEFYVAVGEEILVEPVSFIEEELEQSQLILKNMGKDILPSMIDPMSKTLDKLGVKEKIQEVISQMSSNNRQKLTRYPSPIIDKIIINRFISMQLELESEAKTKALFEEREKDLLGVVESDASSLEFIINHNKLEKLIQRAGIPSESAPETERLLENSINIGLLKDAILALAFENHTVDILPINLNIEVKQKIQSNFLFRFLKLDLRDIYLNDKNKINYGINYQIIDDKLCFYGTTQNYFKGKTLVVQVKNLHQRIVKEIWIHGVSNDFQSVRNEGGQEGYEIF